ncbi:hypothetical protein [Streptomyces sp. NPDC058280]|uniref:hypothetical protein n=1 Tax=Streptomyces sp. NPDC058280 TaxID=3346419 RepID=UPI0036E16430
MNMINESPRVSFEVGSRVSIPRHKVCRLIEQDGELAVHIRAGHADPQLCRDLSVFHRQLLGTEGRWAQTWDDKDPDRVNHPPQGLGLAEATWRIVPARMLPRGTSCLPLEARGWFIWVIRAGLATPRLCAEMNNHLARIVGDGLWVQRWDGGTAHVN